MSVSVSEGEDEERGGLILGGCVLCAHERQDDDFLNDGGREEKQERREVSQVTNRFSEEIEVMSIHRGTILLITGTVSLNQHSPR